MEALIPLLIYAALGAACAVIANSKGRNAVGWFFIGLIFPCIGFILVLVLPDLKVQQNRDSALRRENRRLREQVKKDRMVSDQRHEQVRSRLRAHDQALDIDTEHELGIPDPIPQISALDPTSVSWFTVVENERVGPLEFHELQTRWRQGRLDGDSLVWTDGQNSWLPIWNLPKLQEALGDH